MSIYEKMRQQAAIYWAVSGAPDRQGRPSLAGPVAIACRWDDVHEDFIGPDGSRQVSKAKVYGDRDTPPGGVLLLIAFSGEIPGVCPDCGNPLGTSVSVGTFGMMTALDEDTPLDLTPYEVDQPKELEGAHEIRRFEKSPNMKATKFLRTAIL